MKNKVRLMVSLGTIAAPLLLSAEPLKPVGATSADKGGAAPSTRPEKPQPADKCLCATSQGDVDRLFRGVVTVTPKASVNYPWMVRYTLSLSNNASYYVK